MSKSKEAVTIKKYANRRLYNTGTSSYVTLEDLAVMVKDGDDFVVYDAKSGEDITRSVLAQIIFEQEGKVGQSLLPITFLRQLIRFYGDSMQALVPSYLEFSIDRLTKDQDAFRDQMAKAFSAPGFGPNAFGSLEEMTRNNMAMFTKALTMFTPFAGGTEGKTEAAGPADKPAAATGDLDEVKRQLSQLQARLDRLSGG
jgi:polyhydroxyalkanoate synthesis repressor PhaR